MAGFRIIDILVIIIMYCVFASIMNIYEMHLESAYADKKMDSARKIFKAHHNEYRYYKNKYSKCVSYDKYLCDRLYSAMSMTSQFMSKDEKHICVEMIHDIKLYGTEKYEKYYIDNKMAYKLLSNPGYTTLVYVIKYYANNKKYGFCEPINRYINNNIECSGIYLENIEEAMYLNFNMSFPNKHDIIDVINGY